MKNTGSLGVARRYLLRIIFKHSMFAGSAKNIFRFKILRASALKIKHFEPPLLTKLNI